MKKLALIAVAIIVLAACAGLAEPVGTGQTSPGQPRETRVMVNRQLLWIDQEPIIVRGNNVTLTWRIATTGYEFPKDGIVFEAKAPPGEFQCRAVDRQSFVCVDRNSEVKTEPVRYKYTIKVERSGARDPKDHPHPLDPFVVNDR
jgi:hypothetical protein